MATVPSVTLSSSSDEILTMPIIGMGTSSYPRADPETAKAAILKAIRAAGYRHFDTAFAYGSEQDLGAAIDEALHLGLINSRDDLFITTKLWASFADKDLVLSSIKTSLRNLLNIDMYIIHWPFKLGKEVKSMPVERDLVQPLDLKSVWEAMEECKKLGLARGIGVSNFTCSMLEELLSFAEIPPAVNQLEMNPAWQLKKLRDFCKAKGVHVTAYSPLGAARTKWGDNRILGSDVIEEIALARGKTTAQISLRWVYEQGVSIVTKSYNKERMRQNLDIFDFCLTEEELEKMSHLPQRKGVTFASLLGPHDIVLEIDAEL
ncbi:D-galacturonate reductase-like [Rosa rugosa]|uniref:D-galacturonate reductase-like n=1 Tax=Rosa rugosa TaxID=74645 RepID=UPI002B40116E|nr:D-galacturonate reductase-like [Rosa rugosa]